MHSHRQLIGFVLFSLAVVSKGWFFSSSPPDPFEKEPVKYELYTRLNDDTYGTGAGQQFGKDVKVVSESNFDAGKPTKFFIHGWFGASWNWYIRDMRRALLKYEDVNFIEVDWSDGSVNPNYFEALRSAQDCGEHIAGLITYLHDNFGLKHKDVHVIGHSLGGQAAGAVGRMFKSDKIGRITGLDPAQPGFNLSSKFDSLGPEDADFVDCIHTTFVSTEPMGHVDFYPNDGNLGIPVLTWIHSHLTPIYIYTESIESDCDFTSYKCNNYQQLLTGGCPTACPNQKSCNTMGYHATKLGALGSLYLHINEAAPYC